MWPPPMPPLLPPPERAVCPLWPLPAVLPWPEPGPRPTVFRRCLAPGAGRSSSSLMGHLEDVRRLRDHAAHRRRVLVGHLLTDTAEPPRPHRRPPPLGQGDGRARG